MERAQLRALAVASGCAVERSGRWFLTDPQWSASQRERATRLMARTPAGDADRGWLCIPTGGSSGGLRFARHDEQTIGAAARAFCRHFGLATVNAVDVLPPFHVSGFMARARCAESGGQHLPLDWPRLAAGVRPGLAGDDWVISLVPTQLQRLIAAGEAVDWLRRFRVILLGGGPAWPALVAAAAAAQLPIALSYGMTETAAMVTALRSDEFLGGRRDAGSALPHARVTIGEADAIVVEADSLFLGYWPDWSDDRRLTTEDAGRVDAAGHLHVHGRRDAVIITGGEKVQPAEVEAVLRATGEFADVVVIGVPSEEWGEAVVACYPKRERAPDLAAVRRALDQQLAGYKRPKRYVALADWPRREHGKLDRTALWAAVGRAMLATG